MNNWASGIVVFTGAFGGGLVGIKLKSMLPEHYLNKESTDTIKMAIGLVATMTALILGLVTASAKGTYDAMDRTVKEVATDVLSLDRNLARYGPDTATARAQLKHIVAARIDIMWPKERWGEPQLAPLDGGRGGELLVSQIRALEPRTDEQRRLQSRALETMELLLGRRWTFAAVLTTSLPTIFIGILTFWVTITFVSFGLSAPPNAIVVLALFVCGLSVAGAVFLVLELDQPFGGLIRVSAGPLRYALSVMGQ
jgi:hypothetical protein